MQIKKGIPVSPGVVISRALVIDAEEVPIPRRVVPAPAVPRELERFERALEDSLDSIKTRRERAEQVVGPELAKIFDFHAGMLRDPQLTGHIRQTIESEHVTAEYAVFHVMRGHAERFAQQADTYFRDRVHDIWDLERQLLGRLIGTAREELGSLKHEAIVVAHDLTPSQTAGLDKNHVLGLVTDAGGPTSHTAILAHALGIPAIVGLEDITLAVNRGDTMIIDGNRGVVIIDPDAAQLMRYRAYLQHIADIAVSRDELASLPAVTKDGVEINLQANIEFPSEIVSALQKGATGIGLYRTEFVYLAYDTEPSEEQQYEAYIEAVRMLSGKPLTIRTLDLGADKVRPGHAGFDHVERNPFLGCRSIRLCLQNLPLFKTQLRAILRASAAGPISVMFPLISNVMELRQAKMILNDVMEDLDDEGVPYAHKIPVGIMVEVPSAALQANILASEVDFFSIGTNDLIQYTLAVDRGNERIASLYSAAHPAVIQLIREVVRVAKRTRTPVSLCGEMGGEPEYVMLLLGLGLTSLSITPPAIPEVKRIIRSVTINQCKRVARRVASFDADREVLNYLRDETRKVLPDALEDPSLNF